MGRRALLTGSIAGLLLLTAFPLASADVGDPPPLRFGFSMGSVDEGLAQDVPLSYGSFWVGAWTQKSGWAYAEAQLRHARAANVTPVVNWWYWGDDISPSCVENGCWSTLHSVSKDKATWYRMSRELAAVIEREMGGREAIVVLENEFNKGGISTYEPFDGYLAEHAAIFDARGVKTVVGFGFWDSARWGNFDRAVAASDYAGTMMLRSSVRHASSYASSADDLLVAAQTMQAKFGKPVLLYDFALSSYPEPEYALKQEAQFARLFALMPDFRAAGVEGILFRHLYDNPNFDTRNYNGMAERWWGLKRADGSEKPAYDDAMNGIHEEAVHVLSRGGAWSLATGAGAEARLHAWESGWYALTLKGSGAPVTVTVDGAAVRVVTPTAAGTTITLRLSEGTHALRLTSSGATVAASYEDAPAPTGAPLLGAREAEAFAVKSTGGRYTSSAASGGAGWNLWSDGWIEQRYVSDAPRDVWVRVTAAGDLAGSEAPRMELSINGAPAASWSVASTAHRAYTANVRVPAGEVDLRLAFTNDWSADGKDRNLKIDVVKIDTLAPRQWAGEAESFSAKSTGGKYWDAGASGSYGWNLWSNGYAQTTMTTGYSGQHTIAVVAKGDYARGWPVMRVSVDGVKVGEWTVSSSSYQTFQVNRDLPAGTHTLKVEFLNDYKYSGGDRNLRVDAASLTIA